MVEAIIFYISAAVMIVSSLMIALSRNIVHAATWLLGTLGSAALLYFLLGANLLGVVQIIVYAGGILILIVFGVMLTARNPYMRFQPKRGEVVVATAVALVIFGAIASLSLSYAWPALPGGAAEQPARIAAVRDIGVALLTDHLVPFEVSSVLLLAVMVGAAYLARPEKR